jgi:hypothetical protein
MNYLDDLSVFYRFKVLPQDEIVTNPVIDTKYHLSWASNREMVWVLRRIECGTAFLETPRTKKKLEAKVNDLRHINKNIIFKARKRINNIKK